MPHLIFNTIQTVLCNDDLPFLQKLKPKKLALFNRGASTLSFVNLQLQTVLDKIPLTPNGKIDRKSLIGVNLFSPKNFESPSYHSISKTTELTLIRIWEKILNTSNIPTDQSFFKLGATLYYLLECFFTSKIFFILIYQL